MLPLYIFSYKKLYQRFIKIRAGRLGFESRFMALFFHRAGGLGFEPKLEASKAPVLPLDDPPALWTNYLPTTFSKIPSDQPATNKTI